MKKDKKIGTLRWDGERYLIFCTRCNVRNWYKYEEWTIRLGQLGSFKQNCDYCDEEMNPNASSSMPQLYPYGIQREYRKPYKVAPEVTDAGRDF
jgi:hypothetical protein